MDGINIAIITLLTIFGLYLIITAFNLDNIIKKSKDCEPEGFRNATKYILLIGTIFFTKGLMSVICYFLCKKCTLFSSSIFSNMSTIGFICILSIILLILISTIKSTKNEITCEKTKADIDSSANVLFFLSLAGVIIPIVFAFIEYNKYMKKKGLNIENDGGIQDEIHTGSSARE